VTQHPGYAFVPFPDSVRRIRRNEAVWHRRYENTYAGFLHITLRTEQPVHVGTGRVVLSENRLIRHSAQVLGRPGIPGSTMKGVLRSRYEAITKSCAPSPPQRQRPMPSNSGPKRAAHLSRKALDLAVFRGSCSPNSACPACALLGVMSLRSRVTVRDFVAGPKSSFVIAQLHEQFEPRLHHVGKRRSLGQSDDKLHIEVTSLHGRKFAVGMGPVGDGARPQSVEAIPPETTLSGILSVFNVTDAELGGLLSALGRGPDRTARSALKVGAGKGRRFGRVRVTGVTCELRNYRGERVNDTLEIEQRWHDAFASSPDRFEDGEGALHMLHPGEC